MRDMERDPLFSIYGGFISISPMVYMWGALRKYLALYLWVLRKKSPILYITTCEGLTNRSPHALHVVGLERDALLFTCGGLSKNPPFTKYGGS